MRQLQRWSVLLSVLAALLLIVAGYGLVAGYGDGSDSDDQADAVTRVDLELSDFAFTPITLELPAGKLVELTIRNSGTVEHEWMAGRERTTQGDAAGYHTDLIALLQPEAIDGQDYHLEMMGAGEHDEQAEAEEGDEHGMMISSEVEVESGGEVVLRFMTPADAEGSWEMGCFLPGHYQAGMKGSVIVE